MRQGYEGLLCTVAVSHAEHCFRAFKSDSRLTISDNTSSFIECYWAFLERLFSSPLLEIEPSTDS